MKKLAIVTTHPIQYNAPWFALLTARGRIEVKVFYTWSQTSEGKKFDPGFGKSIEWDIRLLSGYDYTFVKNISKTPRSDHHNGIINPTLIEEIEEWKTDAILIFGWNFKSHLTAIKYFHKKKKVIFRGDSTLLDEKNGIKSILKKIYLRWVYSHIDIALFTGTQNRKYYENYGVKPRKLVFAPHAIDNKRFESVDKIGILKWRESLGIKPSEILILFAGKLEPKKNPSLLLNAFMNVKIQTLKYESNCNFHLVIVGNGVLEEKLKADSKDPNIHFIGFQNQSSMPTVYHSSDIFVLPSSGPGETWGLAINEAMACSKAVIVSDKCGCAIDLVKNENGKIFTSGDISSLTKALGYCLDLNTDLKCMGKSSLNIIKDWNYETICETLESVVLTN